MRSLTFSLAFWLLVSISIGAWVGVTRALWNCVRAWKAASLIAALLLLALPAVALAQTTITLPPFDVQPNLVLVGAILPPIIAVITRQSWRPDQKQIVAGVVCLLAALVSSFVSGQLGFGNVGNVLTSAVVIAVVTETLYRTFYHPTGITDRIEQGVNPDPPGIIVPATH